MQLNGQDKTKFLRAIAFLYLFLIFAAFYFLFLSRTGEAHTVWEALHPAFVPTFFLASVILVLIQLTSEQVACKLLLISIHSFLIHSLFAIIFPVGDLSGQQMALGRTRLVYDNAILHGWPPWGAETIQSRIYQLFTGINFQAALSVVFARMLSIDILWVHLFLVPVLWGFFAPIAAYLTTYSFARNEKAALLASLILSVFPYMIYVGAISGPNGLGFVFFFFAVFFMLKNLNSDEPRTKFLMLVFSVFSLLSHYLTGIMSLSLLILTMAFKSYTDEKTPSFTSKATLVSLFAFCSSLLPLSLIYLRFFRPGTSTAFTLDKLHRFPLEESIGLFFMGELIYGFDLKTIFIYLVGTVVAVLCMVHLLCRSRRNFNAGFRVRVLFLSTAFLLMLVDYRILKLLMTGLPLNEERLWVFRDFIAAPFVALAILGVYSAIGSFLRARSPRVSSSVSLGLFSKGRVLRFSSLLLMLNIMIAALLGGWVTFSLTTAYPHVAPLQTTWYELEAVRFIEENTKEKYVVVGDMWTIFAGEVIVGIYNPRAYYFGEYDTKGIELFNKMREEPSPEVMIEAMNATATDTTVAYFLIAEPRVGSEEFNGVVSRALQNEQLRVENVFGAGRLYIFSYKKV